MKFAEYLSDNLVPEWQDKYLDYKSGKKRIKKITNLPQSFKTPGFKANNGSYGILNFNAKNNADGTGDAFKLPPAAIKQSEDNDVQKNSSSTNDQTPLLYPVGVQQGRISPQFQQSKTPNYASISVKKQLDLSNSVDPATYGGGSVLMEGISLQDYSSTGLDGFVEWLNKELQKIETFYREKERRLVERFLLLQDQLHLLKEEKIKTKDDVFLGGDELVKSGIAKTSINFAAIRKYELPSLPHFKRKDSESTDDKRDYEVKSQSVSYYVARRQLKAAVQEFYRELELLRSYRMLNRTGIRKLTKKCDKKTKSDLASSYMEKVNNSYFASSDVLENLIPKVEDLFSTYFENGNRKAAVEKLRSAFEEKNYDSSLFSAGLLLGLATPLFVHALYLGLYKTLTHELPQGKYLLQIWAGFFLIIFISLLFTINCFVWTKLKINYKFIFEFNPKSALDYREFPFIPTLSLFAFSIFGWFSFNNFWPEKLNAIYWPWFYFAFSLIIFVLPVNVLFFESRKWLLTTLLRLFLSGLYPVEFRDFFMGDIFCSLSYTMGNLSFFFCVYSTHWRGTDSGTSLCSSGHSRLMGFCSTIPPIWRFLQCIRRYADSGDWFPHLANMVKYGVTMLYYITLSVYRIERNLGNKAVFIFFATVNSIYSALWDIFMDWSLMQNKWLLRDNLVYPAWFYYFAIIVDVTLRFQWIFYALFGEQVEQSAVTSFCVAVAEIIRRFIWIFIRMENEHVTNIHLFRAAREAPLPYEIITRARSAQLNPQGVQEPVADEEVSMSGWNNDTAQQDTPSTLRRRGTILESAVFKTVSKAIVNAHAKDFQRRKTAPEEGDHSSDEENSDGENSIINN
ncbi:hypothetical protein WICMUC_002226 [Wickerhamomyces mucosus]|uniref:Uncharacterized protein n=1 Tax=Wickerhamomyces mucosus TaxID=1378264 RepID=A0A9P8PQW9_9ASCO|nr:hypothetical protein WICMUC_002226 [Wickerhamomyces mucosus]